MELLFFGIYFIFCFLAMPVHAHIVSQNKYLLAVQILVSFFIFVFVIADYFRNIPDGESGFVIVGMLFVLPLFNFVVQLAIMCSYYVGKKLKVLFSNAT
ncbi:hypothetical protein [Alteromonas flava]|uniref:hypothetical protein n=1 Tax=Alteromonas flava TaxID=2048003 RepID=UPI000C28AB9E|nr:hypothetical protein [Alteromonas flava]